MNRTETKICQNCKAEFRIEPEDLEFYEKMKVPPPTFCPDCRLQRRMAHWNERVLYKRKCDLCGQSIVGIYSPDKPFKVYCSKCWWSDKWEAAEYAQDYDFSRTFFEQFYMLQKAVPRIALLNKNVINSDYSHEAGELKDCYLCFLCDSGENVAYGSWFFDSLKDSFDVHKVVKGELSYEITDCWNVYKLFFSEHCHNCRDCYFLYDCRNCSNCFACVGLRNKKYYIFNKPYSKEDYFRKLEQYNLDSFRNLAKIKKEFDEFKIKFPRKFAWISRSFEVSGNNISRSKNCQFCFDVHKETENCKFIYNAGWGLKNSYDAYDIGYNVNSAYEGICIIESSYQTFFSSVIWSGRNLYYSDNSHNSHNLFGCAGLRHKSYCILNKQYSKEEYEKLAPKIIKHMNELPYIDKRGRVYKFGEFFPIELSPFGYNETVVQQYFPLSEEEIEKQGYQFTEIEKYQGKYQPTIKAGNLPDHIKDADEKILNETIECFSCSKVYRLIKPELDFLKKQNIPLPRKCPDCRHKKRIDKLEPIKLRHRRCQCLGLGSANKIYQNTTKHFHGQEHCPNEFETPYAPERAEIVYCQECYQSEFI